MARLGIVIAGGDNCANNAVVHYIARNALKAGFTEIIGSSRGNRGLLDNRFVPVSADQIIPNYSSSVVIKVSREPIYFLDEGDLERYIAKEGEKSLLSTTKDMKTENETRLTKVLDNLTAQEVEHLVYIGGQGSMLCAKYLYTQSLDAGRQINIIYVPSSMDNDVPTRTDFRGTVPPSIQTSLTLGYSSAVEKVAECTRRAIPLAQAVERVLFVYTMGGTKGWVACATKLGGGQILVIPELTEIYMKKKTSESQDKDIRNVLYSRIPHFLDEMGYATVGIFEGTPILHNGSYQTPPELGYTTYGKRESGTQFAYPNDCRDYFKKRGRNINPSNKSTDYDAKSGSPSEYDKKLAEILALKVVQMLKEGEFGEYPCLSIVLPIHQLQSNDIEHITRTIALSDIPVDQKPVGVPDEFLKPGILDTSQLYIEFANMITGK